MCQFSAQKVKGQADGRIICRHWADVPVSPLHSTSPVLNVANNNYVGTNQRRIFTRIEHWVVTLRLASLLRSANVFKVSDLMRTNRSMSRSPRPREKMCWPQ